MRLFAVALLFTGLACAQTAIQGTVTDPSGRAVRAARVECAGRSAVSDIEGHFSIPGVERCTALIAAPGFDVARIDIGAGTAAQIQLALAPLAQRVVVSATRREASVEEAGVAATVFTRQDLEMRGTPRVADVLEQAPGLVVARYGRPGSLTQLFTRGGQRTATLIMVDGVPVNDPGGEVNLAGFSTVGLDRVEVVRGPESALFGAEAASGVVQLFTARGNPENKLPRGSFAYDRGSFGTDRWAATLAGGAGARLDYSLAAEQFHTAGEYSNDFFRNTTGSANVGLRVSQATQVRAVVRVFDAFTGVPNQVGYGITDFDANEATHDRVASVAVEDVRGRNYVQRATFSYHRSWDLFTDTQLDGPYNVAALVRDVTAPVPRVYLERLLDPANLPTAVPPGMRIVQQSVTLWPFDPFLSLTSRKRAGYQGTLTHTGGAAVFGYDFDRQDGDITGRQVSRDNHGFFAHEQYSVGGRLFLSGGLRVEHNSAFATRTAPRGAASLRVADGTFVRVSAAVGITAPSLLQNYARDPYYVGNLDLRPEKTTGYEAGFVREWLARRVRTDISAFSNGFRDLIVFVFLPYPSPSTWQNIEASRARGLEFSTQVRPAGPVIISGQYTRMWTRITRSTSPNSLFTGVGQELARRPGNAGALSIALAPGRWSASAGAILVGERQDTDAFVFGVSRNRGYQNVYASGSVRLTKNVLPYVRVNNLLNQRYSEVLGYPAQSRAVSGGLRLEF